jgi:hypothetical protein
MSQPVKLSDSLVLDARIAGEAQVRSIAGQVEFWARLGRSIEPLLDGERVLALCRAASARPLADLVDLVDTPQGRNLFAEYLASEPYPHYKAHPLRENLLVRTDANGVETAGRFVNRVFVPEPGQPGNSSSAQSSKASASKVLRHETRVRAGSGSRSSKPRRA